MAHGLSFSVACGILPDRGSNLLHPLLWEVDSYPLYSKGVSQSVQSLSRVRLFATPWTAARQASLSIASSQSLLKLMSSELVMPSNHLILCHPLLLPPLIFCSIRVFQMSQFFISGGQSIGAYISSVQSLSHVRLFATP